MKIFKWSFLFLVIFVSIHLLHRIPIEDWLLQYTSKFNAEAIDSALTNIVVVISLLVFIYKNKIPIGIFGSNSIKNVVYLIPLLVAVYSPISSSIGYLNSELFSNLKFPYFLINEISIACLEEVLLRGFVFGLLLLITYNRYQNWMVYSVIISSLLFGVIHLQNIWTLDANVRSTFNQIYFTFGIGLLYASVYVKTRNLMLLIFFHFLNNFFVKIPGLLIDSQDNIQTVVESDKSIVELIVGQVLILILFGIPLFVGLLVLNFVDETDKAIWTDKVNKAKNIFA